MVSAGHEPARLPALPGGRRRACRGAGLMGAAIKMTPGAHIADIRARLDAVVGITADDDWEVDREKPRGEDEYYHVLADLKIGTARDVGVLFDSMNADYRLTAEERRAILNFAAAARSDVPWLLDQV